VDDALERRTHDVEDTHWWYRGRRRVLHAVLGSLSLPGRGTVLDAGCGSGRNLPELARYGSVIGVEPAPQSLGRARARGVGEVRAGSLSERLPLADAAADLAVALDVLEHVEDDRHALRELARVVRPGGLLVVTVPQYDWLWGEHDVLAHHHRRYTRARLLGPAQAAGFAAERVTAFNTLLLPAVAGGRALQRRRARPEPATDLERGPAFAGAVLEGLLGAEARFIARGHDLPAGVSLLAVLRR
jgi:SAM-dependent methyltransferase